jgi:hypothetical protein
MALFSISFGPWRLEVFPIRSYSYIAQPILDYGVFVVSYLWRRDS